MQSTVASLMLITSAVILTCVVVNYAVAVFGETVETQNADGFDALQNLQDLVQNQTVTNPGQSGVLESGTSP